LWVVDSLLSSDSNELFPVVFLIGAFDVVTGAAVLVPNLFFGALGVPLKVLAVDEGAAVVVVLVGRVVVVAAEVVDVGLKVVVVGASVVTALEVFDSSSPSSDLLLT
jgi:hypothetical protein